MQFSGFIWCVVGSKKNYEERRQYFDQIKAPQKSTPPPKKKIKSNQNEYM